MAKKKSEAQAAVPADANELLRGGERRIEYMRIEDVLPAARNPKLHAEADLDKSVSRFGYTEPVLLDERTGRLVAGHGRIAAIARRQARGETPPDGVRASGEEWLVPVVRGWQSRSDQEAEAYLLASNRLTELGGWDDEQLAQLLQGLADTDALEGVGFSQKDLDALLKTATQHELGRTPEEALATFEAGEIKQVVLYFSAVQYEDVLDRLATLRERWQCESNTDVFLKLLELERETEDKLQRELGAEVAMPEEDAA